MLEQPCHQRPSVSVHEPAFGLEAGQALTDIASLADPLKPKKRALDASPGLLLSDCLRLLIAARRASTTDVQLRSAAVGLAAAHSQEQA